MFLTCLTTFNKDRIASTLVQRPAVQPSNQTLPDQTDVPAPKPTHEPYVDSSLEYSKLYRGICVPEEKKCRVPARNASAIAARPACTPGGPGGWDRAGRWYKGPDGHYRCGAAVTYVCPPAAQPAGLPPQVNTAFLFSSACDHANRET